MNIDKQIAFTKLSFQPFSEKFFNNYSVSPTSACRSTHCVRWELEWSFDGQLFQEYLYQKLFKSDEPSSSYNQ